MRAPEHPQNVSRLEALEAFGILDTPRSRDFEEITALISAACDAPIALITLVDRDRQWFLSERGLGVRSTPLESSVCAHAILTDGAFFEVPDLWADPRFIDNPLVANAPSIRSFAGAILRDSAGMPMGTVCVIDYVVRTMTAKQRRVLEVMARRVMREIELSQVAREAHDFAGQLAVAAADRAVMLQAVSRALSAPLDIIGLCSALMAAGPMSTAQRAATVESLADAAQAMTALVNDLLDVSTLASGPIVLRPGTVDVRAAVGEAARRAYERRSESTQALRFHAGDDLGSARWDQGRISQMVEYLVAGGFSASGPGGEVSVGVAADVGHVVIRICDQGAPIPPAHVSQLFEPFAAGVPSGVRGGGPRLAVVRGIAEAHDGSVSVRSDASGTCMTIILPRFVRGYGAPDRAT